MISFKNVAYYYHRGWGVENISFEIQEGDFSFLIGPTGSGKTTLLKLIYGELKPSGGTITVSGYQMNKIRKRKIPKLRREIGMVFQDYNLLPDRNLLQNISLPLQIEGMSASRVRKRVEEALELVGLQGREDHYPLELSGGEQQRACVARALVKEPELILADEPTGNLDPVTAYDLIGVLEEIHQDGRTILMATHNYGLIKGRGHRIMEMKDGKLRA